MNWRKSEPEFDAACKEAEQRYCELIDTTIHNRAIDGWKEEVYQNGELVGYKQKYSTSLLLAIAKSRMPRYRDKAEAEINIQGGQVLVVPAIATSERVVA